MPTGDVSVRAVFNQAQNHTVTVSVSDPQAGTANASPNASSPNQWVMLNAQANQGFEFSHWEVVSGNPSIQNTTSAQAGFSMPSGNVSVRAVFRQGQAQNHTVAVSVNNPQAGTASASPATPIQHQWVTLSTQANHGFEFSHWEVVSGNAILENPSSSWTQFLMPANNVSVRAVFRQLQTFSVTASVNAAYGASVFISQDTGLVQGDWVTLTLHSNPLATGFVFSHWEVISGNAVLNDPFSHTPSFQMPASDVSIRAVFRQSTSTVTISADLRYSGVWPPSLHLWAQYVDVWASSGGRDAWAGGGPQHFFEGGWVHLEAISRFSGVEFSHWEVISGNVALGNPSSASTNFTMSASNLSIRAVFVFRSPW